MRIRTVATISKFDAMKFRRHELQELHLMDADAAVEETLCRAKAAAEDLISVHCYLKQRVDDGPPSPICGRCMVEAVEYAKSRSLELEADAQELRARADKLERQAKDSRKKAECHRRQAEQAEADAERYAAGAERRHSEADRLEDEAEDYRRLAEQLAKEVRMDPDRG